MVIKAKYQNGVFRPVEKVVVKEGAEADVYLREKGNGEKPRKSVKDYPAYGMWADRKDIGDGVEYVNRIRKPRWKLTE
jgi:predicted DNA-binding antitoxin AbrB/MazE fold protein